MHASAAQTPVEIRLINKSEPVRVGDTLDDSESLAAFQIQLSIEPSGLTPICKHIKEVVEKIRDMESELLANNQIALLIIMTDGEPTDGNVADMLKHTEGLPIQIIVRFCTDELEVSEYWHNISAQLDIHINILDDLEASGNEVAENNTWLTYGEPLHRAREFGIMETAIHSLDDRLLDKTEIQTVVQIL